MMRYNTTLAAFEGYTASGWGSLGSATGNGFLGTSVSSTLPSRSDDLTTGLFSATASTVSVAISGIERLRVDAMGNVGIGTTSPAAKLHVNGSAIVGDSSADVYGYIFYDSSTGIAFEAHNSANTIKKPINLNAWGGNVGIGTTTPRATLDIWGNSPSLGLHSSVAGIDAKGWFLGPNTSGTLIGWAANDANNTSSQWLNVNRSGYTISSVVFPSGNVGIGTTNPVSKFEVNGGIKPGNDTSTCAAENAGTIRWTGTELDACNGSSWVALTLASGSCPTIAHSSQLFTSSGTFTPPSGVSSTCPLTVRVLLVSGGGGGAAAGTNESAGGGGSGYVQALSVQVTGATSVVVGTGGAGTSYTVGGSGNAAATGASGLSSYFGSSVQPNGGLGGTTNNTTTPGCGGNGAGGGGGGDGAGGEIGSNGGGACPGAYLETSGNVTSSTITTVTFLSATFSFGSAGAASFSGGRAGMGYGAGGGGGSCDGSGACGGSAGGGGGAGGLLISGGGAAGTNGGQSSISGYGGNGGNGAPGVVYIEW